MPPKAKSSRKRGSAASTSSSKAKQSKQDSTNMNVMASLDYTKLASEIIRLQDLKSKGPTSSTSGLQSEASRAEDNDSHQVEINVTESRVDVQGHDDSSLAKSTNVSDEQECNSNSAKQAAMPVVSLLDKIFSGEASQADNSVAFRPSDGIPLGATVSMKIKNKIWNNEFIEIKTLLPNHKEDPLSVSIVPGAITLQQTTKKIPLSLNQWTTCFHIFMAIYIEKKPDEASHLLKYCEFIRELSYDHGDSAWRFYDESFRRLRETHSAPWQQPIEELRGKAIGLNIKSKLNVSNFGFRQNKSKQHSFRAKERTCFTFNRGETCPNTCDYKHACAFCKSGSHNKLSCPKLQAKSNTTQSGSSSNQTTPSQQKQSANSSKGGLSGNASARV